MQFFNFVSIGMVGQNSIAVKKPITYFYLAKVRTKIPFFALYHILNKIKNFYFLFFQENEEYFFNTEKCT